MSDIDVVGMSDPDAPANAPPSSPSTSPSPTSPSNSGTDNSAPSDSSSSTPSSSTPSTPEKEKKEKSKLKVTAKAGKNGLELNATQGMFRVKIDNKGVHPSLGKEEKEAPKRDRDISALSEAPGFVPGTGVGGMNKRVADVFDAAGTKKMANMKIAAGPLNTTIGEKGSGDVRDGWIGTSTKKLGITFSPNVNIKAIGENMTLLITGTITSIVSSKSPEDGRQRVMKIEDAINKAESASPPQE